MRSESVAVIRAHHPKHLFDGQFICRFAIILEISNGFLTAESQRLRADGTENNGIVIDISLRMREGRTTRGINTGWGIWTSLTCTCNEMSIK